MQRPIVYAGWSLALALGFLTFAPTLALAGDQPAADSGGPDKTVAVSDLEARLKGPRPQRDAAANYVIGHPDSVPPIDLIQVVAALIDRGDNAQAAFWYYFWQIRIAAWGLADPSNRPGYGELAAAISSSQGEAINRWGGSDLAAMHKLMVRASTFEGRMPLYVGRPDGVTKTNWRRFVEAARAAHNSSVLDKAFATNATEKTIEGRKQNGLYVGPWRSPGRPLPDNWQ